MSMGSVDLAAMTAALEASNNDSAAEDSDLQELLVDDESAEQTAETTDTQKQNATFDWESDDNPYKPRFKGLQGTVQKEVEARKAAEAAWRQSELQRIQLENQYFETRIANLSPAEQQQARQHLALERDRQAEVAQVQTLKNEVTRLQGEQNELARQQVISIISKQYNVSADTLANIDNPYAMEAAAKAIAEERKKVANRQRSAAKKDSFEGGLSATPPKKTSYNGDLDAAAAGFADFFGKNYKR